MTMNAKTRQITKIKIDEKERVEIFVKETVIIAPDESSGASREVTNTYPIRAEYKPHKDFLEALLATRKFALDIAELTKEDKTKFVVNTIHIRGNMALQNSRVKFLLHLWAKRTGKNIPIQTGEVTMYGDEYEKTAEMTKALDKLIDEAWKYIRGKNGEEIQLALTFQEEETEEA